MVAILSRRRQIGVRRDVGVGARTGKNSPAPVGEEKNMGSDRGQRCGGETRGIVEGDIKWEREKWDAFITPEWTGVDHD